MLPETTGKAEVGVLEDQRICDVGTDDVRQPCQALPLPIALPAKERVKKSRANVLSLTSGRSEMDPRFRGGDEF
jgi:hypothetical protein